MLDKRSGVHRVTGAQLLVPREAGFGYGYGYVESRLLNRIDLNIFEIEV